MKKVKIQSKEEPVFVEDGEEEEVEVRFFVVDLVKELFK